VIIACTVFDTDHESDRQTNGQTPRRWLRRAKHSAVAHKKIENPQSTMAKIFSYLSEICNFLPLPFWTFSTHDATDSDAELGKILRLTDPYRMERRKNTRTTT